MKTQRNPKWGRLQPSYGTIKVLCEQTRELTHDFLDYV